MDLQSSQIREEPTQAKKPYTLRISFTGLCAFVPRGRDEKNLERMDVLLVNPSSYEEYSESHQAILKFSLKNLRGGAENGDLKETKGYWDLEGEDVALFLRDRETGQETPLIGPVGLCGGRRFDDKHKPRLEPEIEDLGKQGADLKAQAADFSWLPAISRSLDNRAGEINLAILEAADPSFAVSARFRIAAGTFGSHSLGGFLGDYVVAQFVPPAQAGSPYTQAVAHWAGVDIEIDSAHDVLLRSTKYDTNDSRDLVLRASPEETLIIEVTNLCCGYHGQETRSPRSLEPDQDYRHFYILSTYYEEIRSEYPHLPIPVAVSYPASIKAVGGNAAGGLNPIRCSGTSFKVTPLDVDPAGAPEASLHAVESLRQGHERMKKWLSW